MLLALVVAVEGVLLLLGGALVLGLVDLAVANIGVSAHDYDWGFDGLENEKGPFVSI